MSTQNPSQILDRALMEAALQQPPSVDPIGQRRLRWLSEQQRRTLQIEIHGDAQSLVGAFMMAYYGKLRLHSEVLSLLQGGPRRAPAPVAEAEEPMVALPRRMATAETGRLSARAQPLAARSARRADPDRP